MGQPVVHFEIGCRNRPRTEEFFSKLFDWRIQRAGPEAVINTSGECGINGHITALGQEPHHYVMFYVQVNDLAGYLAKAEALGGKVVVAPVEIPTGSFAWFTDPDGNMIGLWKAKP